jgi:undecaprenyl-diphosphatase
LTDAALPTPSATVTRVLDAPAPGLAVGRGSSSSVLGRPVLGRAVPFTFAQARRRWPVLLPLAILLPLALGLAATIDGGHLLVWDAPLTASAVAHRSPWIDDLALAVSRLGAWTVVYPVAALLAWIASRRSRTLAMLIVLTVAARPAFEWLLKDLVARPRPSGARLVTGTGFSFPSGHVLAAAATWAFLPPVVALYVRRRALWWAAVGVAGSIIGLVAWSRVWLGVHWTSDVVASLAIAFVALSAIEARLDRRSPLAAVRGAEDVAQAGDLDHPGREGRDAGDAEPHAGVDDLVAGRQ